MIVWLPQLNVTRAMYVTMKPKDDQTQYKIKILKNQVRAAWLVS